MTCFVRSLYFFQKTYVRTMLCSAEHFIKILLVIFSFAHTFMVFHSFSYKMSILVVSLHALNLRVIVVLLNQETHFRTRSTLAKALPGKQECQNMLRGVFTRFSRKFAKQMPPSPIGHVSNNRLRVQNTNITAVASPQGHCECVERFSSCANVYK